MMYHGFPRLSGQDRPVERVDRTELDSLWRMAPDSVGMSRLAFSGKRLQLMTGERLLEGTDRTVMRLRRLPRRSTQ